MKKQILFAIIAITAISITQTVNAQSNQQPLRYQPKLSEDQIIICVTDYKNERYYGQLACIISNDGLDNPTLKKLGNKALNVNDSFELGLID